MGGRKFFDFDAFWEAQDRKPVTIKVFGTPHLLPPALPAKLVLQVERLKAERGDDGDLKPEEIVHFANGLFGKQRVEAWLEHDEFDLDKLTDLFKHTIALYSQRDSGDDEGEPEAPKTGPETTPSETSSSTGHSSSPTSNASTGSISAAR